MVSRNGRSGQVSGLFHQAEEMARTKIVCSPEESRRILRESSTVLAHGMQCEELQSIQTELDAAWAYYHYYDRYNLAPMGYCTLSEDGVILDADLSVAALLDVSRSELIKQDMSRYVTQNDLESYNRHSRLLFETGDSQAYELQMMKTDGAIFQAWLEMTAARDAGATMIHVVLCDVSDRNGKKNLADTSDSLMFNGTASCWRNA